MKRYIISGGGTGGHIFPALAIGEAIRERVPDAETLFVGTRYGMEKDLIPKAGQKLITLPMRGWLGKGLPAKMALLWRLPTSMLKSLFLILKTRPQVVIGVGGYASAPLVWTAALMGRPTMIQEQNAFPGLVNRLSSRLAKLACLGFPEAASGLHCPCIDTGNPVRGGFAHTKTWSADREILLILGGSQGAASLNQGLPPLLKQYLPKEKKLRVVHQCGRKHLADVRQAYTDAPFPVEVTPFIDNMSEMMEHVLLAVTRAGASTIAELRLTGVPAVLVPFPSAAHDHQTFNAKSLAALGAALHVPEHALKDSGPDIGALLENEETLSAMAACYPDKKPDSAGMCADIALALEKKEEVSRIVQTYEAVS